MDNIQQKIYEMFRKSPSMKKIYFKNPQWSDEELLKQLEAQIELEETILKKPILKETILGYEKFFNFTPIETLKKIKNKDEIFIRMEFEEMKQENNVNALEKDFSREKGSYFKIGTQQDNSGENFSSFGRDLYD